MPKYTNEQIERAKNADVRSFLEQTEGYVFEGRGRFVKCRNAERTNQPSSLSVDTHLNRIFYNSVTGNRPLSALDWCMKIKDMDFQTAMKFVIEEEPQGARAERPKYQQHRPQPETEISAPKNLELSEKSDTSKNVYAYLTKTRGIPQNIVNDCLNQNLIYQDVRKNAVFVGYDGDGKIPKYAARIDEISETYSKNSNSVTKELDPNQNHNVNVIFALNQYSISVDETSQNGSLKISSNVVDYNNKVGVVITPAPNYYIGSIMVNGENVNNFNVDNNILTIDNITEDKVIHVDFVKYPDTSENDFSVNLDTALSSDETEYIFSKGKEAVFTTEKTGIRLIGKDKKVLCGDKNTQSVSLNFDAEIIDIELYYADSEYAKEKWHTVSFNKKISFYDGTEPEIVLPELPEFLNCYKSDVKLSLNIPVPENYPQVDKIEYRINDEEYRTLEDVTQREIIISAKDYERETIKVNVRVTNKDGHITEAVSKEFTINSVVPAVEVSVDGKLADGAEYGYYREERTATVKINDWEKTFNKDTDIFSISKDGNELSTDEKSKMISWSSDGDVLTAKILFSENGEYEWNVLYNNLAGMHNTGILSENGDSVYQFIIDNNEMPTGKIKADEKVWDTIAEVLSFGIFKKSSIKISIGEISDNISGIKEISCFVDLQGENMADIIVETKSFDSLESLYKAENSPFEVYEDAFEITANAKVVVYVRIMDNAGNVVYISSDGLIVDNRPPEVISIETDNGIFNEKTGDIIINSEAVFSVNVQDITSEDKAFSGISRVYYVVKKDDTQIGREHELYSWYAETENSLCESWSGEFTFNPFENTEYNQDNICIEVIVEDNSGNSYSKEYSLSVNTDVLDAVVVFTDEEYKKQRLNDDYFVSRKAVVTIRNDRDSSFNEESANQAIIDSVYAVDKSLNPVAEQQEDLITISKWETSADNIQRVFCLILI